MTIAITGATGFLGLRILPLLLRRGEQVVVLARAGTVPASTGILRHLAANGADEELLDAARTRVTVLSADVEKPLLGLPEWQFRAIAEQVTEIWHTAAATTLDSPTELVRRTNVEGTRNVLDLANAGTARLCHVSTAFVAGRRSTGVIVEDDLDSSYGFENPYEESKYLAELAVREWSERHDRPVTIFRPSILVSDRPTFAEGAPPTLAVLDILVNYARIVFAHAERYPDDRLPIRIACDPDAHLNLIPVDLAARLMVAMPTAEGVRTVHVTYPHDISYSVLFELLESLHPVRIEPVPVAPVRQTELELLVSRYLRVVTPYAFHRRHYDRAALRAVGLDPVEAPPLGLDYLLDGLSAMEIAS